MDGHVSSFHDAGQQTGGGDRASREQPSIVMTVGHSNQPLNKLVELLQRHGIEVLVDARSQPYSRFSPQFARKTLERAVREASMRYLFMGDTLGGRPPDRGCYDAEGKILYDRVEEQEFYRKGIKRLLSGIARYRLCLLCGEEDPIRCHRRLLIARTLRRRGVEVQHIRRDGRIESEEEVQARFERELPATTQLQIL